MNEGSRSSDSGGTEEAKANPSGFSMGRVGKHALVYGIGTLASKAISFVMLPVYTRYLTPADYGVMGLIDMTLDVISIVAGAQLALGIFRYYHKAESEDEKEAVVSTAFLALALSYGLVGVLCFVSAVPISTLLFDDGRHAELIRLAAARVALQSAMIVPFAYLRMKDRSALFVAANLLNLVIGLGLNIVLVVFSGMGVKGVFISSLTATALTGGVMTIWLIRQVGLRFSRSATRDLLRYGVPMIGMQFATFFATFGDRYFLQAAAGEEVVGRYHLAYIFGFMLALIGSMPFEQIWAPKRFEIARLENRDQILSDGFVYSNFWLISLAVGMSLFITDVFRVMTQPEFFSAASLVHLVLLAYVMQAWAGIHDIGILVRERTEYLTLANWVAAVVALAAYAILIPRYLGMGAAVGTLLSFTTRWALTYYYSQRLWPVAYRWAPVVRLLAIGVTVSLVGILLPELPVVPSIALHTGLYGLYLTALWRGGVLTELERRRAVELARRAVELAGGWWRNRRSPPHLPEQV